ncbi:MAG TPA: 50S ribosomal protein L25 [Synergistaceae bacterium]|nr:50S ribosomal protein L25 [Synergistaceae bacterium]HQF90778.1 50S ribosomal protein L25 [Synergistaceae bacterium]HQH77884.1 50S ribosomal protein L25 [Synergistaceae bacterium]HQK24042.1 50S ribosomal protein L25 [Synergistaceae bacterium]
MSGFIPITLESREGIGKEKSGQLRAAGYLPAVFYGPDYKDGMPVRFQAKSLLPHLRKSHWETLRLDVTLPDGKQEMALLRDLQRDSISDEVLHLDLYQLVRDRKVRVAVPVRVINREGCPGIKAGGVFELLHRVVEMEVLPREIPDDIVIDAASLDKGKGFRVRECALPESAEVLLGPEDFVALISEPRAEEEEEAEATAGSMDVEVVQKGKKDKDGAA